MKAIHHFIISTDKRYNNKVDVEGKELIVNTEITERDYEFVHRIATVIAIPTAYESDVRVGDKVIVHHNVFRRWYDMKGREKNGSSFIDEGMYRVLPDQIFAFNHGDGWEGLPAYCFVEPMFEETVWEQRMEIPLMGTLVYSNKYLDWMGLKPGDIVGFTPDSEYAFEIDGKLLYRIYSTDITIKYNGLQERERKDNQVCTDSS